MSEFVKRTMIGYKDLAGGHSDPECTHVILTVEEYDDLLREISQAKQKAREERSKAADDQKESEKRLNSTIQQYKQAIEKWREALNEAHSPSFIISTSFSSPAYPLGQSPRALYGKKQLPNIPPENSLGTWASA